MDNNLEELIWDHVDLCPGTRSVAYGGTVEGAAERLRFLSLALAGEAGELVNNVKKYWRDDGTANLSKTVNELIDVFNYAAMLACYLDVVVEDQMTRVLLEAEKRPEIQRLLARKKQK